MPLPSKKLIGFKSPILQPGSFSFRSSKLSYCHSATNKWCPSPHLEWSMAQGWGQEQLKRQSSPVHLKALWDKTAVRETGMENLPGAVERAKTNFKPERQGDRDLYLAQTPKKSLYLPPLPDAPRLFLFQFFSFALFSTVLLEAAGILTRVGLEESQVMNCVDTNLVQNEEFSTLKLPNQCRLWFFQMLLALTPSPDRSLPAWSATEKSSMHICR